MRTADTSYGDEYWATLDGGGGYQDSLMWADIAHELAETFFYRNGVDSSGEWSHVDVGCAYGFLVKHMRSRGCESFGLDFSCHALGNAPEELRPVLRWFDLCGVDDSFFGRERFRLLTCFETLEHIDRKDVDTAVGHLHDLLVPGGYAVLTICVAEHPDPFDDPTHITIVPSAEWANYFRTATDFEVCDDLRDSLRRWHLFAAHQGVFVLRKPE